MLQCSRVPHALVWLVSAGAACLLTVVPALAQGRPSAAEPLPAPVAEPSSQSDVVASAQSEIAQSNAVPAPAQHADDDSGISAVQPDFTVVNLQTALRLPKFGSAFRLTHRFTRPLDEGDFGSLVEDFFGFDGGAQIGLEYRFGVWTGLQAGIYRTSDRTIQFFGQYDALRQGQGLPVGIAALVAVDGTNNFRDAYSPTIGAIVSRTIGERLALYAEPAWVGDSNASDLAGEDDSTLVLGLSGRVRVRPTVYAVVEVVPRLAGYEPGDPEIAFGIEKRVGGHVFQLNFSNSIGTTLAGTLRGGGASTEHWYIGFNLSRKFY
jgi:hypothetical protein